MSVKLRIRSSQPHAPLRGQSFGYRVRPASFAASFGLHALVVAILFLNPIRKPTEPTLYEAVIQPQAHKIIFYDFRKKLPEVAAARKIGRFLKPKGTELSNKTMIAASPKAKSALQFIWQPLPKIEIPRDVPLPNLIARTSTALPPPPAPPKPAPRKAFVPPPQARPTHAPVPPTMLDAPLPVASSAYRTRSTPRDTLAALKLPKTFMPPPPPAQSPRPSGVRLMDAPAAPLTANGTRGVQPTLPEGWGAPSPAAGIAPPSNAPLGTTASSGNANADIAIAGLHPAGGLNGPLPDGARPGRFAKAPELGEPAGGEGAGALTVPDLSIHEEKSQPALPAAVSRKTVFYAETVRNIPISTLSVPLRPSSRTIPAAIDARFQGRSVYTMVVPIENLSAYAGDWILWFAERDPKPGDAPSMYAPVPFRKLEPLRAILAGNRVENWVQVSAIIKRDGTVDRISLLPSASPAVAQAVIQDLQSWEFKPATRDGTPVDVDAVFEIPFNLPVESAGTGLK